MAVYLDHAATSPIRPEVLSRYAADLALVGNPSSVHGFGQRARMVVEDARESLAASLGCHRSEIIFTSGGTEADNLAIKGLFWSRFNTDARKRLIVSAASEHHAVLDVLEWLEAHGPTEQRAELHLLALDRNGMFDLAELESLLAERGDEVALISLMWANNETGVVWPIAEVASLAAKSGVPVHSDAVAALGHVEIDFAASGLALMSVSGHKVGAPVGIGALVVRRDINLVPVNHGGGHERKIRSGTLNAVGASAFALATATAVANLAERTGRDTALKQQLIEGVRALVADVEVTAESGNTLPSTVHLSFAGCPGDSILVLLDMAGVAVSNGSACQAGVISASHVLLAMGRDERAASECIRISFGYDTTAGDIEKFLAALPAAYAGARKAGDAQ